MPCRGHNRFGDACRAPEHLLNGDDLCPSHRPGGMEHMKAVAQRGGRALKAKRQVNRAFSVAELPKLRTLTDAKRALDTIRIATLQRRITHNESSAASKAVSEWVRAEQASVTAELVTKLRTALAEKEAEIATLRRQLQARHLRPTG